MKIVRTKRALLQCHVAVAMVEEKNDGRGIVTHNHPLRSFRLRANGSLLLVDIDLLFRVHNHRIHRVVKTVPQTEGHNPQTYSSQLLLPIFTCPKVFEGKWRERVVNLTTRKDSQKPVTTGVSKCETVEWKRRGTKEDTRAKEKRRTLAAREDRA